MHRVLTVCALAVGVLAGCATSPAAMTPQQKEAAEMRSYCYSNPQDRARCLGFLGRG
jgi:curli biogenesis system outer membrane secretion channel CsgG